MMATAIGKGIGRHVEDAHDQRPAARLDRQAEPAAFEESLRHLAVVGDADELPEVAALCMLRRAPSLC
ncbi:hypothetical protein, partial [Salmonella enterica]|uniref:hypothetical protein n=1 Tax=Salmonella enterica TaxID=28901 RepID=UPI003CE7D14D